MNLVRSKRVAACAAVLWLAACGGDDGGINNNVAGVTASSLVGTPRWGDDIIVKLEGRNLDRPMTIVSGGCRTFTLLAAEPYVSTTSTAYYRCEHPSVATHTIRFTRPSDGVVLATHSFAILAPQVTFTISNGAGVSGDIVITLNPTRAPITVDNFLAYVNAGFYVDTVFHRLVPDFIIQGGGFASPLVPSGEVPPLKETRAPIVLEDNVGLLNLQWTIAMARTGAPDSATSQFFINLANNTTLNATPTQRGYAVFGNVSANTELVTAMTAAPCSPWPEMFVGDAPDACLPDPNLVITAASRTR